MRTQILKSRHGLGTFRRSDSGVSDSGISGFGVFYSSYRSSESGPGSSPSGPGIGPSNPPCWFHMGHDNSLVDGDVKA